MQWLLDQDAHRDAQCDVLLLGTGRSQVLDLLANGHRVWAMSPYEAKLHRLSDIAATSANQMPSDQRAARGDRAHSSGLRLLAATAQAVPLRDRQMTMVLWLGASVEHPDRTELARVLRPAGWVSGGRLVRDDTVPWVRRFVDLMRAFDETAMPPVPEDQSAAWIAQSAHFPVLEQRAFRVWAEVSKAGLIDMATRAISTDANAGALRAGVAELYDKSAGPSGLRLPYRFECWRAVVDHSELPFTDSSLDDGLRIRL